MIEVGFGVFTFHFFSLFSLSLSLYLPIYLSLFRYPNAYLFICIMLSPCSTSPRPQNPLSFLSFSYFLLPSVQLLHSKTITLPHTLAFSLSLSTSLSSPSHSISPNLSPHFCLHLSHFCLSTNLSTSLSLHLPPSVSKSLYPFLSLSSSPIPLSLSLSKFSLTFLSPSPSPASHCLLFSLSLSPQRCLHNSLSVLPRVVMWVSVYVCDMKKKVCVYGGNVERMCCR